MQTLFQYFFRNFYYYTLPITIFVLPTSPLCQKERDLLMIAKQGTGRALSGTLKYSFDSFDKSYAKRIIKASSPLTLPYFET